MTPPAPSPAGAAVDRIRRGWYAQIAGSREQALFALLVMTTIGGAHLARLGTGAARAATAAALLGVVVWQLASVVARRREARSTRLTVRRVLFATDAALGERAMRALTLVGRAEGDETVGSAELAALHFSRLVDRVSDEAVKSAGVKYAQRFRGVALGLLCVALAAVLAGPVHVVEGLNVLAANRGRAPLTMSWLAYGRLSAHPPSYTRETERALVFGTVVELPKGTVVTVRGVPRAEGRTLVVTDGTREEPFASDGAGGVVARYVVKATTSLRVAARFGDVRVDDEESLEVRMVPDLPPTVEVEGAPRTTRLADAEKIDVRWVARDDHGLREVDLVLRAGAREERRVLARFDGETRVERGGHVLKTRDPFLRRMFLPVSITVEAKDDDPLDGPKWRSSLPIVVIPPEVGQPEAERYAALLQIRDALVDLLAWRTGPGFAELDASKRGGEMRARLSQLKTRVDSLLRATHSGASVPRGLTAFVRGQLERLGSAGEVQAEGTIEDAVLGVDVALGALGNRDAADVAKRLADVAEEVAAAARHGRESEKRQDALSILDVALVAVEKGAAHLELLSSLGHDLGSVARADAGRIRHARAADDLLHAELAALHLAARLHRPTPSFGATTGSGGRGGVESGRAHGGGQGKLPPPSEADQDFDRAANAVSQLASEHESALRSVEAALKDAERADPSDAERAAAKKHADAIREAVNDLPLPGEEFGTPRAGAALARGHAAAAAHALDDLALSEARESAESALGALEQAERRLDPTDPLRESFGEARQALGAARDWARSELERRRVEASQRAARGLEQASDTERDLGSRAAELAQSRDGEDAPLPEALADGLERAGSVMREAAKELAEGHGERGAELQREAQRLLEQARPGRTGDESEEGQPGENPQRRPDGQRTGDGKEVAVGGDVPAPDDLARAEEFRRRVLQGLGRERSERLAPAVRRYAEGLLR